jgi:cyclic-di-GMP phosphodiesterase TipF (flagellum assembly factor)
MRGYGSLFLALCMMLIAASAGTVLHFVLEFSPIEASLIALSLLFAMTALEVTVSRRRERAEFADRFEGLARASADIAREVGDLRYRVIGLEKAPPPDTRAETEPLVREINALAELIEDVAHSVSAHEALLTAQEVSRQVRAASFPVTHAPSAQAELPIEPPPARPIPPVHGPLSGRSEAEIATLVRKAIDDGRIELYLQPVVTLPQRKVRFYEALTRMRLPDDTVIEAAKFLPAARTAGLLPKIDERLVQNCVAVVRRLAAKNREVGLFLNIAPETLTDRASFVEIFGNLEANRALAPSLIFELPQHVYRSLTATELNSLALIAERGFRFSLDRIEDFRIDPRGLAERGVRFIKVPAELMLNHEGRGAGHIHPADLSDLLSRHGIELVADRIESENIVVDLLDFDVRLGQGYLFAQPRPVRAEVLLGEREPAAPPSVPADLVRRIA